MRAGSRAGAPESGLRHGHARKAELEAEPLLPLQRHGPVPRSGVGILEGHDMDGDGAPDVPETDVEWAAEALLANATQPA